MTSSTRTPTVFLPHGGGPWPFVDLGIARRETDALLAYLRSLSSLSPKAMLVISAHWESERPTVTAAARPELLFDY